MERFQHKKRFLFLLLFVALVVVLTATSDFHKEPVKGKTIVVTDSIGRKVEIPYPLTNVALTNPYTLEMITAIGADDAVKHINSQIYLSRKNFPRTYTKDQIIGGFGERGINYEKVIQHHPQVLILTGGFNWQYAENILGLFGIKVLVIRADSPDQFLYNTRLLGKIFGKEEGAEKVIRFVSGPLNYVNKQLAHVPKKTVYYEVRKDGRAGIPGEPFNEMLHWAHVTNIFEDSHSIYINPEYVVTRNPDGIVRLSAINEKYMIQPKPAAFYEDIRKEIKGRPFWSDVKAVKNNKVMVLSYYVHGGASKFIGAMYVAKFLYPEQLPDLHPDELFAEWLRDFQHMPMTKKQVFY